MVEEENNVHSSKAETSAIDQPEETSDDARRRRSEQRPYPRKPLSEALKVVTAIKEHNAGKPWPAAQIADAIGRKQRSSDFQYIVAAARDFDLIDGNFRSDAVTLTELGKEIAYPKSSSHETEALFKAFMNVNIFKLVYEYYEGSPLPETKYLANTLIDHFKISHDHVDEFINIFEGNCRLLGINVREKVGFSLEEAEDPLDTGSQPKKNIVRSGRHTAFVIMPFVERNPNRASGFFREVFNSLIKPAAQAAGFEVEWANQAGSDVIQSTIINKVLDADIIIADMTDHNPNVLFELGLRVADNNGPIALIKTSDTGRLFDVDNMMRVYEYNPSLWTSTIEIDVPNLESHIRAAWENRGNNSSYMDILRRKAS